MTNDDDKQPRDDARPTANAGPDCGRKAGDAKKGKPGGADLDSLTRALRSNYQSTVDEGVPDSFQDLINKLK